MERVSLNLRGRSAAVAALVVLGALGAVIAWPGPAQAVDFPKRKPGLWSMQTSGGPFGAPAMEQCIDAQTDDLLRVETAEGRTCSKPVVTRDGERYRIRIECEGQGSRQVMNGVYTMDGDAGYRGEMQMRFTPPLQGVSEMNMQAEGRWAGACRAGMKPGDVVIQGLGRFNPLDASRGGPAGGGAMSPEELGRVLKTPPGRP